jgi:hypothetical protein
VLLNIESLDNKGSLYYLPGSRRRRESSTRAAVILGSTIVTASVMRNMQL